MTIVSGPLQFVSIANMLSEDHFSHLNNQSDSRFSDMMRDLRRFKAVKNKAGWERSRMGAIGNHYADKFAARLASKGWTPETSNAGFHFEGWKIDPEKSPELKAKGDLDAQKAYLKQQYGVDAEVKDGQLLIKNQAGKGVTGYLQQQRLMRGMLTDAGYNKVVSAIGARAFAARYAITWHPLKNSLHGKTNEKLTDFNKRLAEAQAETVYEGDPTTVAAEAEQSSNDACQKDPNSKACSDAKSKSDTAETRAKEAGQYSDEAKSAEAAQESGNDEAAKSFRGKIAGSLTKGFAAAIGVLCILQGLDKNYDQVKEAQVVAPLIRIAVEFISVGSQIQSGQEVNLDQLSQLSGMLYDNSTDKNDPYAQTGWSDAEAQRAEDINAGNTNSPQTLKGTVKPDGTLTKINSSSPLHWVENIPGLSQLCSPVGSLATSILGGGIAGTIAGELISRIPAIQNLVGQLFDVITQWMLGRPVTAFPAGGQTGNYLHFGSRLAANAQGATAGGANLSGAQVAQLDNDEQGILARQFASSSISNRLFNPTDSRSLLGRIVSNQNPNLAANATHMATSFTNIWRVFADIPATIFGHRVSAAASVNLEKVYGFPEIGFSDDDMQAVGDPIDNATKAANLLDNSGKNGNPDYVQKAKKCFGVDLVSSKNKDGSSSWDVQIGTDTLNLYDSDYTKNNCGDSNSNWRSIRFFVFDTETMKSAACYEGDDQSCNDMNFNGNAGSANGDTNGAEPTPGDAKEIASQLLKNKNVSYQYDAKQDVTLAAAGKNGTCNKPIDAQLLKVALDIAKNGHKISISAIESHCTGHQDSSLHYSGKALDLATIDGIVANKKIAAMWPLISGDAKGLTFLQRQCTTGDTPNGMRWIASTDPCTHEHIQVGG